MAKILSISAVTHDCGVAYIEDGNIKYAFEEERFKRVKGVFNQFAFPDYSLKALGDVGISPFDDDVIVVMPKAVLCGLDYLEKIVEKKDIFLYGHHYSHACTAYYLSGFSEDTLVLTYDGGDGNGISDSVLDASVLQKIRGQSLPRREPDVPEEEWIELAKVAKKSEDLPCQLQIWEDSWWYKPEHTQSSCRASLYIGSEGNLTMKEEVRGFDSIAAFWNSFCHLCGMFGGKDEGKIVGLAAQGSFNQEMYDSLGDYFKYDGSLQWKHHGPCYSYFTSLDLKDSNVRKDASYMLQYLTENYFLDAIQDIKKKYPHIKKLALAGGLFSNVKVNQKINELSEFDEIFISPGMTDGGLALGAAIAKANELGEFDVCSIDNVFWGNETKVSEVPGELSISKFSAEYIAKSLEMGKVVGVFSNRREWGPRALGGTSILFDPRRNDAQEYVNRRLNRNEVMPFAPVVMDGFENIPFHCYKSKYASQFMTICYNVKDEWVHKIPGVINKFDNTSRIQIVKENNKPFFPILLEFNDITGIPVLMNTSFNVHGEPIINTSVEAFKHLIDGVVDILIVNENVYEVSSQNTSIFDT